MQAEETRQEKGMRAGGGRKPPHPPFFLGLLDSNVSRALVALFLQIIAETFSTRHVAWGRAGSTKLSSLALVALSVF